MSLPRAAIIDDEPLARVLFLDVRMPEMDGFELLDRFPRVMRPLVVFVSAYRERALDAFEAEAVDYLLKPLCPGRLDDSVARVRAWMASRPRTHAAYAPGLPTPSAYAARLAVPDGARLRMVPVDDILMLVAQANYVELVLPGRRMLLREPLTSLLERLDPACFLRVHRSRAVRIDMIEHVEAFGAGQFWLRLRDGSCITTGRSYRQALRNALGIGG